jgi:flagellar hook-associated protein 2
MANSTLSVGGLATGIDTKSLVTQLMALERRPENLLTAQKKTFQSQIDAYNLLSSSLGNLKTAMAAMNTAATFQSMSASVADSSFLTATASSTAAAGTHTVEVTSLAKSQRQVSAVGYASATDLSFKTGSITIAGGDGTVSPITIDGTNNSLNGIADAINKSGANITASVINGGTDSSPSYRLILNGKDTNNYTITYNSTGTAGADGPTFPQSGPTYVAGAKAGVIVDGIAGISRTSNNIADVIPGVTINLLKIGTTTITVNNDTSAVTAKINNLVSGFNDAMGLINKYSAYDTTKKTAGVLSGDSTLRSLRTDLQRLIGTPVSGVATEYSLLSKIGITSNATDGTLSIDSTKLSAALSTNFAAVTDLFTLNTGVADLASTRYGIAEQFNQRLDKLTHAYVSAGSTDNGIISTRINGLNKKMSDIDDQVTTMERLLSQKEDNLNKQFAAMESLVSNISTGAWGSLLTTLGNMTTA